MISSCKSTREESSGRARPPPLVPIAVLRFEGFHKCAELVLDRVPGYRLPLVLEDAQFLQVCHNLFELWLQRLICDPLECPDHVNLIDKFKSHFMAPFEVSFSGKCFHCYDCDENRRVQDEFGAISTNFDVPFVEEYVTVIRRVVLAFCQHFTASIYV